MTIKINDHGRMADVQVAEDLFAPEVVTVKAVNMSDGPDVEVTVVPRDGRLVAKEVRVYYEDGRPVTTEDLRAVRVANLTSYAARKVMRRHDWNPETGTAKLGRAGVYEDDVEYVQEHGLDDRTLQIVAHTYRLAMITSKPPTKTVEEWLGVSRATAGRWVAAAREKGYLGKSEGPGKAGG